MAKQMQKTVPDSFGFRGGRWQDRLKSFVREVISGNMRRHKGTEVRINLIKYKDEYYILATTNNEPFESIDEIVHGACVPFVSDLEDNACHGAGLVVSMMAACEQTRNPLLVLGSWTGQYPNDKFVAAVAYPASNRWNNQESPEWAAILRKIVGKKFMDMTTKVATASKKVIRRKHTVYNLIKISLLPKDKPSIQPEHIVSTMFGAYQSVDEDVNIQLCETLIDVDAGNNVESVEPRRRILPYQEYIQRFRDRVFEIPCDDFKIQVADGVTVTFEDAHIEVDVFPGLMASSVKKKSDPATGSTSWLVNLRDHHSAATNYTNTKGSQSGSGRLPTDKVALFVPCVYEWQKKHDPSHAHSFARFQDNNLATYTQPETAFRDLLGLQFRNLLQSTELVGKWADDPAFAGCRMKPGLYCRVILGGKAWTTEADDIRKPYDHFAFLGHLKRRGDFYAENEKLANEIMKQALRKARKHVPAELKHICEELFPIQKSEFVPIRLDDYGGGKKKILIERNPDYLIYDLDKSEVEEGKLVVHAGSVRRFAIMVKGHWVGPSNLVVDADRTRGIHQSKELTDSVEQFPVVERNHKILCEQENGDSHIPVCGIKVDELHTLNSAGEEVSITPDEYVHSANYYPSRNIYFKNGNIRIHLGIVVEVPKKIHTGGGKPRPGTDEGVVSGPGGRKPGTTAPYDYSWHGRSDMYFTWDEHFRRLRCNFDNEWVKKYFCRPNTSEAYIRQAESLYRCLNAQAGHLHEMVAGKAARFDPIKQAEILRQYATTEQNAIDAWFYCINYYLGNSLGEEWIKSYTDKLDTMIGQMEVSAEVSAD
jgi:hypothetical protein